MSFPYSEPIYYDGFIDRQDRLKGRAAAG